MRSFALVLSLVGANAMRDVPLGECYDCEVTCFEDCALKFTREIILPDASLMQLSNGTAPKANRTKVFAWRAKHPETQAKMQKDRQLLEEGNKFAACLKEEKCQGHPLSEEKWANSGHEVQASQSKACAQVSKRSASMLAVDAKRRCAVSDTSCAEKCAMKLEAPADAKKAVLLQKKKDFPLHPVKINSFARGEMNLDFCMKSCLTATCGCSSAPGFESTGKFEEQVKANAALGYPVKDTPPSWQYRKATLAECAKGVFGKKITSGLYVNYGKGWMEIGTEEFMSATVGMSEDITPHMARWKSTAQKDVSYGCIWNNELEECVVGFQRIAKCNVRYQDDTVSSKFVER